jgi:phosphoribosylformylglycinamidine synthase
MKVAVVIFPGSNCDHDALHVCESVMGWDVIPVWHEGNSLGGADLVILPGGLSYGDYLRCGAVARFSPIMEAVAKHAKGGGLTLGICNGFQVLIEAGLLPGALLVNRCVEFRCQWTHIKVQTADGPFMKELEVGDVLKIPIAHGEGNYFAPPDLLKRLNDERRVAFRYCDADGRIKPEANPNGSVENIAGVLGEGRNVLGMMPHPERASELVLGSQDGKSIFQSLGQAYADVGW